MPAIVRQMDKCTGITYVYKSVSFWDREKQQSRARRKLIGKVDPETRDVVPTRKRRTEAKQGVAKPGPVPAAEVA